jgi:hypothetical protein
MPLDTRIALGVQPLQVPDPLAQYGQVQNILAAQSQRQAAGTQNELAQVQLGQAQMTMRRAQEAQDFIDKTMEAAAKNNAPTKDPMEAAIIMSNHPNEMVRTVGQHMLEANKIVQAYQQDRAFAARGQQPPSAVAPSVSAALPVADLPAYDDTSLRAAGDSNARRQAALEAPVTAQAPFVETRNLPARGVELPPATQVPNQLAPAPAATAASVNNLAKPTSQVGQIDAEIADLMTPKYMYSPQAKARIEFLTKRRDQLTKAHVVGTDLVTEEGKAIYTGKEKDSPFEQLLSKSNLSENEKIAFHSLEDETNIPARTPAN